MTKRKARKQRKKPKRTTLRLAETNPYTSHPNSEVFWTWEKLKEGILKLEDLSLVNADGVVNVTQFSITMGIVANPLHPDNNWSSVVEQLVFDDNIYLRLATELPLPIVEYWKKHKHPPACGWSAFTSIAGPSLQPSLQTETEPLENPYSLKRSSQYHKAFNLAVDWIPLTKLISKISKRLCDGNDDNARSLWNQVSNPKRNNNRSRREEKIENGVKMVRVVVIANKKSSQQR